MPRRAKTISGTATRLYVRPSAQGATPCSVNPLQAGSAEQKRNIDYGIDGTWDIAELANSLTHGIGFVLSLAAVGLYWHWTAQHDFGLRVQCVLFAFSMVAVYFFSTLSHVVIEPVWRYRMRAWDQGTIYMLIAGTYSPFIWQGSPRGWTGTLLGLVWSAAVLGFISKVIVSHRIHGISTVTYVLMGWLPALPLISQTPAMCFLWMFLGGLSYTFGILFLLSSHKAWFVHSIWHLAVMLGSLMHCIAIYELLQQSA